MNTKAEHKPSPDMSAEQVKCITTAQIICTAFFYEEHKGNSLIWASGGHQQRERVTA